MDRGSGIQPLSANFSLVNMRKLFLLVCVASWAATASAQQLDSIFFNLYTDSLKRGTYNYINVEGKFSDGTYLPLGEKELKFSSSKGSFAGNSLFVDSAITDDKIRVRVEVRKNPRLWREIDIYIKKFDANERLPTMDEVLRGRREKGKKKS